VSAPFFRTLFSVLISLILPFLSFSQNSISLEQCREGALLRYKSAEQREALDNLVKGKREYLRKIVEPELSAFFIASYQSAVTDPNSALEFGFDFELTAKDRYRSGLLIKQLIYGGGEYRLKGDYSRIEGELQKSAITKGELDLFRRVDELFFATLLMERSLALLERQLLLLQEKFSIAQRLLKEGRVASNQLLEAEIALEEAFGRKEGVEENIATLKGVLSSLTAIEIADGDSLVEPTPSLALKVEDPLFERGRLESQKIDLLASLSAAAARPKLHLFAVGGYGRPALDYFSNNFEPYGVVGLSLIVPISDWRGHNRYKRVLSYKGEMLKNSIELSSTLREAAIAEVEGEIRGSVRKIERGERLVERVRELSRVSMELFSLGELSSIELNEVLTREYSISISLERERLEYLRLLLNRGTIATDLIYSNEYGKN